MPFSKEMEVTVTTADVLAQEERTKQLLLLSFVKICAVLAPVVLMAWLFFPIPSRELFSAIVIMSASVPMYIAARYRAYSFVAYLIFALFALALPVSMFNGGWFRFVTNRMYIAPALVQVFGGIRLSVMCLLLVSLEYVIMTILFVTGFPMQRTWEARYHRDSLVYNWILGIVIFSFVIPYFEASRNRPLDALQQSTRAREQAVKLLKHETEKLRNAVETYSHEIRTPMNAVVALTDSVADGLSTSGLSKEAALFQTAAKSLVALANNVMDVSAIEAHALRIENTTFNLPRLLKHAAAAAQTVASTRHMFVEHTSALQYLPQIVIGDGVRLQQILYNLLSNAVTATRQGSVVLHVTAKEKQSDRTWIEFVVEDFANGIGLRERLFEKTGEVVLGARTPKTTLGLFITRKLIYKMGGTISIANKVARTGTIVRFRLPLMVSSTVTRSAGDEDSSSDSDGDVSPNVLKVSRHQRPLRILYADDEPANHFVLATVLRDTPYNIVCVSNGAEAVQKVQAEHYDMVFLDVEMPVMNGVDAMVAIRQWEAASGQRRMPIAFLTAHTSYAFAKLDADNVIPKPINRPWLLEAIALMAVDNLEPTAPPTPIASAPITRRVSNDSDMGDVPATAAPSVEAQPADIVSKWNRLFHAIDAPTHIREDVQLLWKYRAAVVGAAVFFVCMVGAWITPLVLQPAGFSVVMSSQMLFPVLMRLKRRWIMNVYVLVQQLFLVIMCVALMELQFDSLPLGHILPPMIVLRAGGSMRWSHFCSFVVVALVVYLHYTLPFKWDEYVVTTHIVRLTMMSHIFVTGVVTMYLAFAHYSRWHCFDQLSQMCDKTQVLQKKIERKRDAAEQFVTSIANDFRAPVGLVLGLAEALSNDKSVEESLRRRLVVLESSCQLLLNMMHNILDVRNVESRKKLSKVNKIFRIRDTIMHVTRMLSFHSAAKQQLIRVHISHAVPDYICEDSVRLQQILLNLLGNSIKFGTAGSIVLYVDVPNFLPSLGSLPVDIHVNDMALGTDCERYVFTGSERDDVVASTEAQLLQRADHIEQRLTIDSPEIDYLHLRFVFVDNMASLQQENQETVDSAAIGLKISRELIAEMNGGMYTRGPYEKQRVRFSFALPLQIASEDAFVPEIDVSAEWPRSLNILLVEESLELLYIWERIFLSTPHRVMTATNATDAIQSSSHEHLDVVLIGELFLPDMHAFELSRYFTYAKRDYPPAIIILSRILPSAELQMLASDAGAMQVEPKPLPRTRLLSLLHNIASKSVARRLLLSPSFSY
eukprot:TRINITY_DN10541_c0_g1_i1.p1 TRINITY_DN10541_c0_g1~~TRINITY_DN10541_c0_g1_i1.p1  ORF type:complete len:1275 (+),score=303.78 TRINITY_DN10541_c0_g1_i1:74-3898(+)